MANLQREVWEGWTAQSFIDELSDQIDSIMLGKSWQEPFKTKKGIGSVHQGKPAILQEVYSGS